MMVSITIAQRIALVFIVACIATTASAQPLDSLIALAQRAHPSVDAARIAIERSDARARAAEAWEPPRVGFEIADLPLSDPNPFGRGESMVMAEQMIPLFGQNRRMAAAERLSAAFAETELAVAQRDLAARVEREYLSLWLLDRRYALNAESRVLVDAMFKAAEVQYTVGRAVQSDLFRVTLEIERLGNQRREIIEELAEARGRMNAIIGRHDSISIAIADTLAFVAVMSFDSLSAGIDAHPALRQMDAMAAMSLAEADAKLSMLDPMLMIRGGISFAPEGHPVREGSDMLAALFAGEHASEAMEDPMRWGITVGAMLSIPIAPWSRGGPEAVAQVSRLEAQEQMLKREVMKRDMSAMLRRVWSQGRRAQLRLEFHRRTQIPLLETTLQTLKGEYENGRSTFTSLIDAYLMLVMARMDAYMQEMEHAMARAMIVEIAGAQR
ncbi:MAG: TolC family protein [bacterium]|nr:TolC family protein [Candidatus Kapabacteria bacterium]